MLGSVDEAVARGRPVSRFQVSSDCRTTAGNIPVRKMVFVKRSHEVPAARYTRSLAMNDSFTLILSGMFPSQEQTLSVQLHAAFKACLIITSLFSYTAEQGVRYKQI